MRFLGLIIFLSFFASPSSAAESTPPADLTSLQAKAEQGDATAQHDLGGLYAKGQGVPQDSGEAYFWLIVASASGDRSSVMSSRFIRDDVANLLSQPRASDIQKRAREWKPTPEQQDTKPWAN